MGTDRAGGDSTPRAGDGAPAQTVGRLRGVLDGTYARISALNAADFPDLATAAAAAAGRTLILPDNYSVTVTSAITLADDTRIRAERGALITVPAGSTNGVFILGNRCRIEGVTIEGNGGSKSANAYAITGSLVSDSVVEHVKVQNWRGNAVHFVSTTRCSIRHSRFSSITRTGGEGCAVRFTYTGTTDTVDPEIVGCVAVGAAGTAFQLDGEWNRTDWRTAGVKVRYARVEDCHAEGAAFAGVFINSGFGCTISGCTTNGNGDYGIGYEYSSDSVVTSSTAKANTTYGFALMQNDVGVAIVGCTATANTQHGFWIQSSTTTVPGDTAGTDCSLTGCTSRNNGGNGLQVTNGVTRVAVSNFTASGNTLYGIDLANCSDVAITGGRLSSNTLDGIRFNSATDATITGADIHHNGAAGVQITGNSTDITIASSLIHHNVNTGIRLASTSTSLFHIHGNRMHDNAGWAIDGSGVKPTKIRITGNHMRNNSTGGVQLTQPIDTEVADNKIFGNSSNGGTGVALLDSAGFSGARCVVARNHFRQLTTGVNVSTGANASAGDDFWVEDNIMSTVTTEYVYTSMGTSAALHFRGRGTGTPESVVRAAVGSIFYRVDGGASTSLYVKESGANTNTGWIAK